MGKAYFMIVFIFLFTSSHCLARKQKRKLVNDDNAEKTMILGGAIADEKYVKGTALVYGIYDGSPYQTCTGTIISSTLILTAAHCVSDYNGNYDGVTYGAIPATKFATMKEYIAHGIHASKVWIHKYYQGYNYGFDVAILELSYAIPASRYTRVYIASPPSGTKYMKAVGYGLIDNSGAADGALVEPLRLMDTWLVHRPYEWCEANDPMQSPNEDEMICATSVNWPTGGTGVCYGDSGGPLFYWRSDDKLFQAGLVSYYNGNFCGEYASFPWYVELKNVWQSINWQWKSKSFNIYNTPVQSGFKRPQVRHLAHKK